MSVKLLQAFKFTNEEHADAFERFSNAFLVDDYPEITPLGSKKDQGMDAYIYDDESGKVFLVLQSCVSPASGARAKILGTVEKLKNNNLLPEVLIYCTSATIGTCLDETKKELRKNHKLKLEVCDAAWFVSRQQTSINRSKLSETYANETLEPLVRSLQPDQLYNIVLEKDQQRVAIQYLEALNLDRSKQGNLTKAIFDSLIACVTRDSDPPNKAYSSDAIVAAICGMFPEGHSTRIQQIVPGRILHLTSKRRLHFDQQAKGYVLSFEFRNKLQVNIQKAQEKELGFLASLGEAVRKAAEDLQVDYEVQVDKIVQIGHKAVLWYLREQGKVVSNPTAALLNILNAEKLLDEFLKNHPLQKPTKTAPIILDQLKDLLPPALFATLNTKDQNTRDYLRSKADLFIVHSFLQVTPDVQEACSKLLSNDIIYLDTTILIRCIAEYYSTGSRKPLIETLKCAKQLGYQLRTWSPYMYELVSHLRNRVLKEWINHYQHRSAEDIQALLPAARTLVKVFCTRAKNDGKTLPEYIEEIIGTSDFLTNTAEFLNEVFGIETEDFPEFIDSDWHRYSIVEDAWLRLKKRRENIDEDSFRILVENDVKSFVALIKLRQTSKPAGPNYGHKIWYLSFDRMPWRVAEDLYPQGDSVYNIAMSLGYLMNSVATLAIIGKADIPEEFIPATTILEEADFVTGEIRAIYEREVDFNEKPFLQARRLRQLTHQLKSSKPMLDELDDIDLDHADAVST